MAQEEHREQGTSDPLLEIRNLSLTLGGNRILDNVNLDVSHGHIHALIGPNGAGKTTLIRCIMGGMPHKGTIRFFFGDNGRIGYVPQLLEFDHSVPITVYDFLFLMLRKSPLFLSRHRPMREEFRKILAVTECEHLLDRGVGYLSGGEFRRVLLAQALVPRPELLLLDEPASNVDEVGARHFEKMLLDLKQEHGHSILMISHDMQTIMRIADRVTGINRTVTYDGTPADMDLNELFVNVRPAVGA
jgi:zinc transport system ATP-binding protein